ncbi:uncharacterized protein [Symphalangus syndactylus]|uniref:uncharacterized protein n=1 Tax=Symphalangus syndactylus TaxID=9590 RepID=UPI002442A270|nr:uncharacterized protein LOC129481638 [Symphalangus syndactylus]
MRGLDRMEIRGGRYLLLGEVLGHSALGAQPAQAAHGDADELLELPTLLQRPAGQGPCTSLRGCCISPATALLLSHRRPAQRRSMQAAAAEAGSLRRGRLGEEPGSQESWSRSAPQRCRSQDADRVGSQVCCSRPQGRGGGDKKPRRRLGAKSRGSKNPRRRRQKAAAAGSKSRGDGGKKPRGQKAAALKSHGGGRKKTWWQGQKAAATESRGGWGKKPRRQKQPRVGGGQKAAEAWAKSH